MSEECKPQLLSNFTLQGLQLNAPQYVPLHIYLQVNLVKFNANFPPKHTVYAEDCTFAVLIYITQNG